MSKPTPITDQEFLSAFEALTLDPVYFDHSGHIRLAWLYLSQLSFAEANHKVCTGIKAYGESLGAHDKFNLTLTDALVRLMARRMKEGQSWSAFTAANNDLFSDALSLLAKHFSKELLFSDSARVTLQQPDRQNWN